MYAIVALTAPSVNGLTASEVEIARAVLEGRSAAEIARARGTSRKTVEHQLEHLYAKLGCHSRAELVLRLARAVPTNYP
ncbi:MAG: helix-turn-helix transcriptional regulator [Archangium sp.]|nr:helix-turn-helix transcriptional regulator [Archangium sp.]